MSVTHRSFIRVLLIVLVALVSASMNQTAQADTPSIVVTAVWRPGMQLSTIDKNSDHKTDPGDDLRYVDLELDATTNVQFWATELTCTVNKAALESYAQNSDPGATGDDTPIITWAGGWTLPAAQVLEQPFNPATGAMTIAAANSANSPLGENAVTTSLPLVTIRYRVKAMTAALTSPVSCTGSFLDTNGKSVQAPTFVMPPALNVVPFFTISGNVSYQGRTAKSGIGVICSNAGATIPATTEPSGNFVIQTRVQGTFICDYFGDTSTHGPSDPELYLRGRTTVALNTLSYKLLPSVLAGGDLDRSPASASTIDGGDVSLVTSNYNISARGDINGDGKTDKSDLAIVGANLGLAVTYPVSHILFGTTRGTANNGSHIWMSEAYLNPLVQLIPGANADNWPAVSPDGSKIVVTRRLGTAPNFRYALFIMNTDGTGTATQLTPITGSKGSYDAFAASWSPDGSHIAFNCATFPDWQFNDSSLCLIDTAGHAFRVLDTHTIIYPPAWLNSGTLIYGGNNSHSSLCVFTLCQVTINDGSVSSYTVPGATGTIDMPSVSAGALFYRNHSGVTTTASDVVMAELRADGQVAAPLGSTNPFHRVVSRTDDYFAVRSGSRDFMIKRTTTLYEINVQIGPTAWQPEPSALLLDAAPDPDPGLSQSDIYALRSTVAWVP